MISGDDLLLKFCSPECHQKYVSDTNELTVQATLSTSLPRSSQEELLCIHAKGTDHVVAHFNISMRIYYSEGVLEIPTGCFYATYQFRSPFLQELLEFIISDDLSPGEPLLHLKSESALNAVTQTKNSGLIQSVLTKALEQVKAKDMSGLLFLKRRSERSDSFGTEVLY